MNTLTQHGRVMDGLMALHQPILPLLAGREIHYVDVPMYDNVGDLLIMAGTLAFFRRHHISVAVKAPYFNYRSSACPKEGVIVCQGGGNFGDLYGPFQQFRERLIADRPDCRIVVLPQSFHFSSPQALQRATDICQRHPDLHLCVRDQESQAMAAHMTRHVYLMPDMAHQLWPLMPDVRAQGGTLYLQRRDPEAARTMHSPGDDSFDWCDLVGPRWRFALTNLIERPVTQAELRLRCGPLFGNWLTDWWIGRAAKFIEAAARKFAQSERIVSDRLHAHILSCLVARPHTVHDNSYGKNSRYVRNWTHASPLVTLSAGV